MQITKIIEGVVDLETGEQHSMGVMIKTLRGESFLPLNTESIQRLVELWAQTQMSDFEEKKDSSSDEKVMMQEAFKDALKAQLQDNLQEEPDEEEPENVEYASVFDEDMFAESFQEPQKPKKTQPTSSMFPSMMDEESHVEFEPDPEEEEPEEIDEYSDPFTGTASI